MKVLIIFLSLVFVGCVTATTNPTPESLKSEPVSNTPRKLASYGICMDACERDGGSEDVCHSACAPWEVCKTRCMKEGRSEEACEDACMHL